MLFAATYPEAPASQPPALHDEHPSRWQPDRLYREGMFHGPSFQAVKSIDRIGSNGLTAVMEALPADRFLRSDSDPGFIAEPVILDAAGQLVGFWTLEMLESGFVVFPYHMKALDFYGPPLSPGQRVTCQVRCTLLENMQMRSDIDILDDAGRLRMRLNGWDDKRFDIPRPFYRFILNPSGERLSEPWAAPLAGHGDGAAYRARRMRGFPKGFFQAHYRLWERVLAHLVLTPAERRVWRSMAAGDGIGVDKRRIDWLLGRVAAKEALAVLLEERYGLRLNCADLEIVRDGRGSPQVSGDWLAQTGEPLALSIAHSGDVAAAVVGPARPGQRAPGVGIDVEPVQRQDSAFADVAFSRQEQSLLANLAEPPADTWPLRIWCAKEAVGKALGYGLAGGPHSVTLDHVDTRTGFVYMNVAGVLAEQFPELTGRPIAAFTARENGLVVASVLSLATV